MMELREKPSNEQAASLSAQRLGTGLRPHATVPKTACAPRNQEPWWQDDRFAPVDGLPREHP